MTIEFSEILKGVTDDQVKKARATKAKKVIGRPKKAETVDKEQKAASQAYIDNFEPVLDYRPEPKRLIQALSLPEDRQQEALEVALRPRQLAFCREFVIDHKQKDAAIRAGYSPKTAEAIASNLMAYKGIRRLIDLYTQSNAQKITTVDPDWIVQKITEIVTTASRDGDKLRGLELLARHLGMFIERTEISGRDGEAIRIEETKNKADEVARRLREMGKKAALSVVT